MALNFIDPISKAQIGSTALGREVLTAAVSSSNPELAATLAKQPDWRKTYQGAFAAVAREEFATSNSMIDVATKGLEEFEKRLVTESGELLIDVLRIAWRTNKDLVATVVVKGLGQSQVPRVLGEETLEHMVAKHIAEPGIVSAIKNMDATTIKNDLLIALAGGAEYSPSRMWLDWGGSVAIVARPRVDLWQELITRARKSAGTLYVPVLKSKLNGLDAQALSE